MDEMLLYHESLCVCQITYGCFVLILRKRHKKSTVNSYWMRSVQKSVDVL